MKKSTPELRSAECGVNASPTLLGLYIFFFKIAMKIVLENSICVDTFRFYDK